MRPEAGGHRAVKPILAVKKKRKKFHKGERRKVGQPLPAVPRKIPAWLSTRKRAIATLRGLCRIKEKRKVTSPSGERREKSAPSRPESQVSFLSSKETGLSGAL